MSYYTKIDGKITLVEETDTISNNKEESNNDNFIEEIFEYINKYNTRKNEIISHILEGNQTGAFYLINEYQEKLKNDQNDLDNKKNYIIRNTVSLLLDILTDQNVKEHDLISETFVQTDYISHNHIILSCWIKSSFEQTLTLLEQYECKVNPKQYNDFFNMFNKYLQRKDYFNPEKELVFFWNRDEEKHDTKMRDIFFELTSTYNLSHDIDKKLPKKNILNTKSKI